jgi:hypothetical protein
VVEHGVPGNAVHCENGNPVTDHAQSSGRLPVDASIAPANPVYRSEMYLDDVVIH